MNLKKKRVNFALQGGGAHGAFTWGILDKFLELDLFLIEGISATSAGSMNALLLAQGMLNGGNAEARKMLYEFWHRMSDYGRLLNAATKTPIDYFVQPFLSLPINYYLFGMMSNIFSPYEFNPFNFNPIREVLNSLVDIEKLKNDSPIKLFICATNVRTGKIRIFKSHELSIDVVLASACLPKLFQAVEINGDYYWDGGYLGNPAIFPLIYNTDAKDIIIMHVVPIDRSTIPETVLEIETRLREVSFNSSLMREMRAIAFVSKLIDEKWLRPEYENRLKRLNLHCLRADQALENLPLVSVYTPDWDFLLELRELGKMAAESWIKKNYDAVGNHSTIDFSEWL